MSASKVINNTEKFNTSAEINIGQRPTADVVKHIKVQGARKDAGSRKRVLAELEDALMPAYQAKAAYEHFQVPYLNPFFMNQLYWDRQIFSPNTKYKSTSKTDAAIVGFKDYDVRQSGLDLSTGVFPIKANDNMALLSTTNIDLTKLTTSGGTTTDHTVATTDSVGSKLQWYYVSRDDYNILCSHVWYFIL